MDSMDKLHSDNLRNALNKLLPSGPNGFEGLVGLVLGELMCQSFRLASSGSQRGRDGDSAFDGGETYFESKRYDSTLSPNEVKSKLFDLVNNDTGQLDLWILAATCEVSSQITTDIRRFSDQNGIGTLVLDWSNNDLGSLLIAIVHANDIATVFIRDKLADTKNAHLIDAAVSAIEHFCLHPEFGLRLEALRRSLSAEEIWLSVKARNQKWLGERFSDRRRAIIEFGQPLAPLHEFRLKVVDRPVQADLMSAFKGQPSSELFAVIGSEGVGKSWLVVNSWLNCTPQSLLIVCTADEFVSPARNQNIEHFIIEMLIKQTGMQVSDRVTQRWLKRIQGWRANPNPDNVRVSLLIDGLNQIPNVAWARKIDQAAIVLKELGGCLIITTRSAHWSDLRTPLVSNVTRVKVADWSSVELHSLLRKCGIDSTILSIDVFSSLRNPRILSIAVELLDAEDIEDFDELSVGRLMFEHMRKAHSTGAAAVTGTQFAELLKNLASQVLVRNKSKSDDLKTFDSEQVRGFEAVASCRFFEHVSGSSTRYNILSHGLVLGLALYLIESLETEIKNGRDPRSILATILDPISALDETAKIVALAVQVACIDEYVTEVSSLLIEHLVSLQNLQSESEAAFVKLVKYAPMAFIAATERVNTLGRHVANSDWLLRALMLNRDDPRTITVIAEAIKSWLSLYSLAPERAMFKMAGRDSADEVAEERKKRQERISEKIEGLTQLERAYLEEELTEYTSNLYDPLHDVTLYLLSGRPLLEFVPYLVRWSFAHSLSPSTSSPYTEFRQLIRYNPIDWAETRDALLTELKQFEGDASSDVGKWAIVEVLSATGDVQDAHKAEELADWLNRDREQPRSWSLIEQYCATDPCDPNSTEPENVTATALKYKGIDSAALAKMMGRGSEDTFFDMARAGVVRFHLEYAQEVHSALAEHVLNRTGPERRHGMFALREHSAALTTEQGRKFANAGQSDPASLEGDRESRDEWVTAQIALFIGIPHLLPDEQIETIARAKGYPLLLNSIGAVRPASAKIVEQVLEEAASGGSKYSQAALLAVIHFSQPLLTPRSWQLISQLSSSPDTTVRAYTLGIAARNSNRALLHCVVEGGWDTREVEQQNHFEKWYGSSAIVGAAKLGLLEVELALDRMDITHYGFAAIELDQSGARAVALRIDAALRLALDFRQESELPEMTMSTPELLDASKSLVSLDEVMKKNDLAAQLVRTSESVDQFNERKERENRAFDRFAVDLTSADATLILSDLTLKGVEALVQKAGDIVESWYEMLLLASDSQLINLRHFSVQVIASLAHKNIDEMDIFLERVLSLNSIIRRIQGYSGVSIESLAVWSKVENQAFQNVCRKRLIGHCDDAELSLEVLAAFKCGKGTVISCVVDELLASKQPANICRALCISGFSDINEHAQNVISLFEGAKGFIGNAQRAAKLAYRKNEWARHWYNNLLSASSPIEFWRGSVLFTKVVDARYDIWKSSLGNGSDTFRSFSPSIQNEIKRRIEKLHRGRGGKLFGDRAPDEMFLKAIVQHT